MTLDDGESFNLDYAVRSSVECVTPEGEIAIHGIPGGCKGYDKPWAISFLRKNQVSFRQCQCTCEQDKAKAEQRKRQRDASNAMDYRALMGLGLGEAAPCRRFMAGECKNNRTKGRQVVQCSSSHNIPGCATQF